MRKIIKLIFFIFTFIFLSSLLYSQNLNFGVAFDNFSTPNLGFFGKISSNISEEIKLNAELDYLGENNYNVVVSTSFSPFDFFRITPGFDILLENNFLYPGFMVESTFSKNQLSEFKLNLILGLNPENLLQPNIITLKSSLYLKNDTATLNMDFRYQQQINKPHFNFDINTLVVGFQENIPFKLGFIINFQFIFNLTKSIPFSLLCDLGMQTDIIKNDSITTIGLKLRPLNPNKKYYLPIFIFISKTVTF